MGLTQREVNRVGLEDSAKTWQQGFIQNARTERVELVCIQYRGAHEGSVDRRYLLIQPSVVLVCVDPLLSDAPQIIAVPGGSRKG